MTRTCMLISALKGLNHNATAIPIKTTKHHLPTVLFAFQCFTKSNNLQKVFGRESIRRLTALTS